MASTTDTTTDQLQALYLKKLMEQEGTTNPLDRMGSDISAAPSVGGKILTGLGDALQYLNTGSGRQLSQLLVKDPFVQGELREQGQAKQQQEFAAGQAAKNREVEKTKSIGDYLSKKAEIDQQNKMMQSETDRMLAGLKAQGSRQETTQNFDVKQADMKTKYDTIDKSGLTLDAKLKAKEMITNGVSPEIENGLWQHIKSLGGLIGPTAVLKDSESVPTITSESDYNKLPKGSKYTGTDGKQRTKK